MPVLVMEELNMAVNPGSTGLLERISGILAQKGILSYLVGGYVRDYLLERETDDIDIAVSADALTTARDIADVLGGKYITLDEENHIGRVIIPGEKYYADFSTLRGNIEEDLARRDFTANAIAVPLDDNLEANLQSKNLIDPYNGQLDLRRGIIKAIGATIFKDDAVRLLRAVRIAGEAGLSIDSATEKLIRQDSRLITGVAGERVREELLRLMALPGAGRNLAYLDNLGLLTTLIPELESARGVDQPGLHVWDVFEHSLQTISAVEFLLREGTWEHIGGDLLTVVPWSERLIEHFRREVSYGSTRRSLLKLAALLHDVSKPQTKTTDSEGRTHFLGHQQEGATVATAILERLRFSNREIDYIQLLIEHHMRPTQMSNESVPSRRAIYRFFRDTGDAGIDLLFLSLADHLAARGATLDMRQWQEHARMTDYVLEARFQEENLTQPVKLVDGREIMNIFGMEPGPRVGELLEAIREGQGAGDIITKEQAIALIRRLLNTSSNHTERTGTGEK